MTQAAALQSSSSGGDRVAAIASWLEEDPAIVSQHTRRGYLADLRAFETWRGSRPLTMTTIEAYAAHLQRQGRPASSVNRVLAAIRWYVRRLGDVVFEDLPLDPDQREELVKQAARAAQVPDVRDTTGNGERLKGRHVAEDEIVRLLIACEADTSPMGVRDAAMIALARQTGMRRMEIAGLRLADVRYEEDGFALAIIHGRDGKRREAYLYDGAAKALTDWLALRSDADLSHPLFCVIGRGTHLHSDDALSGQAMQNILTRRATQAGIQALTWHDFRRTLAGDLLDRQYDILTVQKLLGHASPNTTANYDRRERRTRQNAIRSVSVPYRGQVATASDSSAD